MRDMLHSKKGNRTSPVKDGALVRKIDGRSHQGRKAQIKANAKQYIKSVRALKKQEAASAERAVSADAAA